MFRSSVQKTGSAVIAVLLFFLPFRISSSGSSSHVLQPYDFNIVIHNEVNDVSGITGRYSFYSGINGKAMLFVVIPVSYNKDSGVYDPLLGGRFYINSWGNTSLAAEARLLMPFGESMYDQSGYVYKRGVNQFSTGFHVRQGIDPVYIYLSAFHNFLEEEDSDLYGSLWLDPRKKRTYQGLLGLNPLYKGSFMSGDMLRNDWYELCLKINTEKVYPFVPSLSVYYASAYISSENADINIDGGGAAPLLVNISLSYYITQGAYFQSGIQKSFLVNNDYPSYSITAALSAVF